jgi:hypothetical protein
MAGAEASPTCLKSNIEQGISNDEVFLPFAFIIPCSVFYVSLFTDT